MKKKIATLIACAALFAAALPAAAEEGGAFDASNFSATVTGVSDYLFRGISQTNSNFAIQGSFDYAHPVGVYVGTWASNVSFGGGIEIDYYAGFANDVGNFSYDVGAVYYNYPKSGGKDELGENGTEFDYLELYIGAGYTFADIALSPSLGAKYYYSPDFFGEDDAASYISGTLDLSLPYDLGLSFLVGYQDVDGDKTSPDGFSYAHYSVGVTYPIVGFDLGLTFSNTFERDKIDSGFADDAMDERFVVSISKSL